MRARATVTLAWATIALAALAAPAAASSGSGAMTDEQAYELTCGHLGVPCEDGSSHHARAARHHAHAARHHRSARVRAHVRSHAPAYSAVPGLG